MPKKNQLVMIALAALASGFLAACTPQQQVTPPTQPATDAEEAMAKPSQMLVTLFETNESGQSGTATIDETSEGLVVTLQILGASEYPDPQPAHIHVGPCPDVGEVKYPLTNVIDGYSQTVLENLTISDITEDVAGLSVNVHKSADEADVWTACGDLK